MTIILECIYTNFISDNIIRHFMENNLFSSKQFGFIKGKSIVTQLLEILDKRTDWLESGGQINVIYADLEKAFD